MGSVYLLSYVVQLNVVFSLVLKDDFQFVLYGISILMYVYEFYLMEYELLV